MKQPGLPHEPVLQDTRDQMIMMKVGISCICFFSRDAILNFLHLEADRPTDRPTRESDCL